MKTLIGLIPLAIVIALASAAIWWLLHNQRGIGVWVLAGAIVAHGLIHALFFSPVPAGEAGRTWPFNFSQSWLSGAGLGADPIRVLGTILVIAVIGAALVAGLATVGLVIPTDWWRPAVAVFAAVSALTLAVYFEPQLLLGLAMDGALIGLVVTAAWTPATAVPA
jgi:hypothetical protein